ncbi:MAG: TetR/AcrR family transcriptional regulator [Leptospiraceae bacterium]|nr:TetR/AcrR family transcriptional regulator [Leptospiraceae bacterium]
MSEHDQQTTSPQVTTSRSAEAAETIEKILQATIDTISRMGYEGASMKEIAASAGVSKALLHYHFQSKEELMLQSLKQLSTEVAYEVREHVMGGTPSLTMALDAAQGLFDRLLTNEVRVAFLTEMYATATHNENLRGTMQRYVELERDLILEVVETALGPFKDQLIMPLERLAMLVHTSIVGLSIESVVSRDEHTLRERFQDILQILASALFLPALQRERDNAAD